MFPSATIAAAPLPVRIDPDAELKRLACEGREVAARIAADQARLVELARQVDELKGSLTARYPGSWMAWQWGLSNAEVRRVVTLADKLHVLPGIRAAFAAGQVSEATALALVRVATPTNEAELLEMAEVATATQLQTLLRRYVSAASRPDETEDAGPPEPVDECSTWVDDDGILNGRFRLSGVRGAHVANALRAMLDQLRHANPDVPVSEADALVAMALSAIDATRRGDGTLADRYLISIQVDADGAHIPGHGPLSMDQLRTLLPEALVSLLINDHGVPVTVTSPKRLATREQRITLGWRDRTCRFPGCGRVGRLRAHHIQFATNDGPTQIRNLLSVCDTHHTEIHKHHFDLVLERDGHLTVTRNGGPPLPIKYQRPPPGTSPPRSPKPRLTGTGDCLTHFGSVVTIDHWLTTLAA